MSKIAAREARERFSDLLTQAAFGKERIVLTRNGKDVAAIVPMEDLQMIEALEDRIDVAEAGRIMADKPELLDWESFKSSLAGEPERKPGRSPAGNRARRSPR